MRYTSLAFVAAIALSACATATVEAQPAGRSEQPSAREQLHAYPAAAADQTRHVLILPASENEGDLKVQLLLGKTKTIDCNHHALGGEVETRTVQGWGYDYYVLPSTEGGMATLMGCPPGSDREAFVTVGGETIVRYNSRLPIVVYTPKDVELRYRVWRAGEIRGLD